MIVHTHTPHLTTHAHPTTHAYANAQLNNHSCPAFVHRVRKREREIGREGGSVCAFVVRGVKCAKINTAKDPKNFQS